MEIGAGDKPSRRRMRSEVGEVRGKKLVGVRGAAFRLDCGVLKFFLRVLRLAGGDASSLDFSSSEFNFFSCRNEIVARRGYHPFSTFKKAVSQASQVTKRGHKNFDVTAESARTK